ncbi:putative protein kinase RLK-Pelle-Extensin family [Helianthus annuus]|nr:putative protein kinase RLK-Pelle-Extensin family [Helianthus annuus]
MSDDQMEINSVCDLLGIRVIAYSPLALACSPASIHLLIFHVDRGSGLCFRCRYEVSKGIKENSFYSLKILDQCSPIHLNLVLLSATGGFGKSNVIGQGGFGSVYRGVLQDGRKIAVKLMDQAGKQGEEEFRVEVEMLSRLCSPYLLALIGYCSESHHRVLVYDFLANGGLQEHLYPIKGM